MPKASPSSSPGARAQEPQPVSKALVAAYRAWLIGQGAAPGTVNLRLSPRRNLPGETADDNLLDPALATGIGNPRGVKQQGIRGATG